MKRTLKFLAAALLLTALSKKLFERAAKTTGQPIEPPCPDGKAAPALPVLAAVQPVSRVEARAPGPARPATPPAAKTWTDVLGSLLVTFVGIPLAFLGWWGLICIIGFNLYDLYHYHSPMARDERALASLPLTPVRSLVPALGSAADAAGSPSFHDGALVRVEGFLCGDPPIAAFASPDQFYALQCLLVTHEVRWDTGETYYSPRTYTDHKRNYRPRLWLNVDPSGAQEGRVEVCLPKNWRRFSRDSFVTYGKVDSPVVAPKNIERVLALQSVVPRRGQEWELWAVPQNAHVTVLAPAHLRQGRVVLELDKGRYGLVSPGAWQYIAVPPLPMSLVIGGIGLLVFCASLPLLWYYWDRA